MTARIEPLRDLNAAAVGRLLAAAHLDYPVYRVLLPNPRVRMRALSSYLTAIAHDAAGWGDAVLAKDGTGEVGVALWLPPGAFPLSLGRKARMAPPLLRMGLRTPRATAALGLLGARMARHGWREPTWYLRAIGVHPHARRRGVGSLMLAPVLARADEEGTRCALHTADPAIVPYFQAHGFRITGSELAVRHGAASYLTMVRPPR